MSAIGLKNDAFCNKSYVNYRSLKKHHPTYQRRYGRPNHDLSYVKVKSKERTYMTAGRPKKVKRGPKKKLDQITETSANTHLAHGKMVKMIMKATNNKQSLGKLDEINQQDEDDPISR